MRSPTSILLAAAVAASVATAASAASLSALTTFGGTDGWRAPGEIVAGDSPGTATGSTYNYLGTANNERGLAFGNGHLYVPSRNGGANVRILDAGTGADLGALSTSGITGGLFVVNQAAVDADGAIYVANLTTTVSASNPFKVYKYATEGSTPTAVISDGTTFAGGRLGDSFNATGSGSNVRIAAGVVSGTPSNGYVIGSPTAGTSVTAVAFPVAPAAGGTANGDFKYGVAFAGSNSAVLGTGSTAGTVRNTTYSGSAGTLVSSLPVGSAERFLAYTVLDGVPLLAAQSSGDAHVSIYNLAQASPSNPNAPLLIATGNLIPGGASSVGSGTTGNGNASGQIVWGNIINGGVDSGLGSATLYAMSTNSGIQAFTLTGVLPEPTTLAALAGAGVMALRRRRA